ncbi:E3 ubiquitin-protein ligase AMFR [Grus japonensis]|uniref:E3 ubiquitin-protein ligase AMFR n=1 Tax=Grus japonensis TaxID=30415 RepID=A0ABC9Y9R5_GRUJA
MRERYPFSEDDVCHPGKWTTMERAIQYLRELAMREMVYYDLDNVQLSTDPGEEQQVPITTTMVHWQQYRTN